MTRDPGEILRGGLDSTILKTLEALGPLHGFFRIAGDES